MRLNSISYAEFDFVNQTRKLRVLYWCGTLKPWESGGPRSQENTRNERFRNSPVQGLKDIDQLPKLVENEPIENFGGNVQKALSLKQMSNSRYTFKKTGS